jgi:DNA-directed RNA polymerase specialized sigma24 family protein
MMASQAPTTAPPEIEALFESFVTGLRGETLRAQLAGKHPERTREEIDDAIQTACKCFIDETEGITAPGQVYRWIRTVAHRALNRERERLTRQVPVDPSVGGLDAIAADSPTPEQLVIDREDEVDLAKLAETVASTLPDRQRAVLAL